ncbi:16393_t:CDS:2 [Acaulospora colombiana]|uniref:16393_t:CDS:1 n=1 Tax=Acaulospora colombiana TaxID=27376 RepID=A0ACA9KEB7_9GLOM|nr:16393_t:CDS:2 [Acaulospora colombiana]
MSAVSTVTPVSVLPTHSQRYTCLACQVAFETAGNQRSHYGTDWHRYNLKRKVAELPPVTYSAFEQKVLAQQALSKNAAEEISFSAECSACGKTYYSKNAYANHLQSNKHKVSEVKATQEGKLQKKKLPTILHKDGDTLRKEETQQSIEEIDKGHCKIAYDRDEDVMEIVDFYDFTSSYPVEGSEEGWEHVDDEEWEDVEDDVDSSVGKSEHPMSGLIYEDDTELVLPSGARIGHRSLWKYYKQSLRPEEERDSVIINRLITQYGESFGYTRNSGGVLATKGSQVKRSRATIFQEKHRQQEFDLRVGVKANKLQRHYRAQIL